MDNRRLDSAVETQRELSAPVRMVEAISWKGGPVHMRSNTTTHLAACGGHGGSGRWQGRVELDQLTCPDCQALLAAHLLMLQDSDMKVEIL